MRGTCILTDAFVFVCLFQCQLGNTFEIHCPDSKKVISSCIPMLVPFLPFLLFSLSPSHQRSYIVDCPTVEDRNSWITDIRHAITLFDQSSTAPHHAHTQAHAPLLHPSASSPALLSPSHSQQPSHSHAPSSSSSPTYSSSPAPSLTVAASSAATVSPQGSPIPQVMAMPVPLSRPSASSPR